MPAIDPLHESATDDGLPETIVTTVFDRVQMSPLDGEITGWLRETVRVKPFWPAKVIVEFPKVPAETLRESGDVRIIGSWTVTRTAAVRDNPALVPETVTV